MEPETATRERDRGYLSGDAIFALLLTLVPLGLAARGVEVNAYLAFTCFCFSFGLAVHWIWRSPTTRPLGPVTKVAATAIVAALIVSFWVVTDPSDATEDASGPQDYVLPAESKPVVPTVEPSASPPSLPVAKPIPTVPLDPIREIQISIQCYHRQLPIRTPVGQIDSVLLLNKTLNTALKGNRGFNKLSNVDGLEPAVWPLPGRTTTEANKPYVRCDVVNTSDANIAVLHIPLSVRYGEEQVWTTDNLYITSLVQRQPFSFAIVNECPVRVQILAPRVAMARHFGENRMREFNLMAEEYLRSPLNTLSLQPNDVNPSGNACD
jgi:hypothetical protein